MCGVHVVSGTVVLIACKDFDSMKILSIIKHFAAFFHLIHIYQLPDTLVFIGKALQMLHYKETNAHPHVTILKNREDFNTS